MQVHTRRLVFDAVLTAVALALSVADSLIPLSILFPLPGFRIGLANFVTVFALCRLSAQDALLILVARCLLSAVCSGAISGLLFSLSGGLLAFFVMFLLFHGSKLSLLGICIGGAAAHNIGQIGAAMLRFQSTAPLFYLPPLLIISLFSGFVIGLASLLLVQRIPAHLFTFQT